MWLALMVSVVVSQNGTAAVVPEVLTLGNGMRWVLLPRPDRGLVSGIVTVRAGGVHEREGATGVAHMLEHLAFAGTPIVGSVRGWRLEAPVQERVLDLTHELAKELRQGRGASLEAAMLETQLVPLDEEWRARGSSNAFRDLMVTHEIRINAWTSKDSTSYWGEFPQEQLHLWLGAEAQRFAAPVFREFRKERDVVIQELRDRQTVRSAAYESLYRLAFEGSGYAWGVGGREADLRAMSPRSLDVLYERLYSPENAVGSLVGEFDPAQARTWLEETFGQIPRRDVDLPARVAFTAPRSIQLRAPERWVVLGFEAPAEFSDGEAPNAVLTHLLSGGDGLLAILARESEGKVTRVGLDSGPGVHERHLTIVSLQLGPKADSAAVRAGFFARLASWTPSDEDVSLARVSLERERLLQLRSRRALATELSNRVLFTGVASDGYLPRLRATTTAEVLEQVRAMTAERAWAVELVTP